MFDINADFENPDGEGVISDEDSENVDIEGNVVETQPEPEIFANKNEETNTSTNTRKRKVADSKEKRITNKGRKKKNDRVRNVKGNKSESEKIMDKEQVGPALVEDDKEDSQSVLNEVCTIILPILSYTL